jgi:hypothetical protein
MEAGHTVTHSPTDRDWVRNRILVVTQPSHDWVEYDFTAQLALMYPL